MFGVDILEVIRNIYDEAFFVSNLFNDYIGHLNYAFLDIETTGINAEHNKVILIGIMEVADNQLSITQFFTDHKSEEIEILEKAAEMLKNIDCIINYNATSFDIPFLNKRFLKNNIYYTIPNYASFDLYRIIKNYGYIRLQDYKLKTVEKYIGINRKDTISGKESIQLYNLYEKTGDHSLKEQILQHNLEDIYYLAKILPIIKKYDLHKIIFENSRYIKTNDTERAIITQSKIKKSQLIINGKCFNKERDYSAFTPAYDYKYTNSTNIFTLNIPLYVERELLYIVLSDFGIPHKKIIPLPHIPDDILIIKENDTINYMEINSFLATLIKHLYKQA